MLKQYYNKQVNITDNEGRMFTGIIDDYFFPEDNESGVESIVLKTSTGDLYEFTEMDIQKIIINYVS